MSTAAVAKVPETQTNESKAIIPGFNSLEGFELAQRAARLLAQSSLVPKEYQNNLPNCVIALNMALRMNSDPLMVMQNLHVINGRPSWSSQFLISTFNTCGRFSALRYEWVGEPNTDDWGCRAWAIEKATGEKLVGATVTIGLAKKEGWYNRPGSKWQTMPQQMLMYRAAAWFIRAYAPEIAMGMQTAEELADTIDLEPEQFRVLDINQGDPQAQAQSQAAPTQEPVQTGQPQQESLKAEQPKVERPNQESPASAAPAQAQEAPQPKAGPKQAQAKNQAQATLPVDGPGF